MGTEIKRNKDGLYQLKSTISDEYLHDKNKWITENEVKQIFIENAFCSFVEKAMGIYLDFPNGYTVNDRREFNRHLKEYQYKKNKDNPLGYNKIFKDFNNVIDELKLEIPKIPDEFFEEPNKNE